MNDTTMLLTAIGSLAGVIVFLWKQISSHHQELVDSKKECDEDRERLHGECRQLWKAMYQIHPAAHAMRSDSENN